MKNGSIQLFVESPCSISGKVQPSDLLPDSGLASGQSVAVHHCLEIPSIIVHSLNKNIQAASTMPEHAVCLQSVQSSLTSGGRLRGSAFWYLTAQAPGDSNPRFEYSIGFEDSTFMCVMRLHTKDATAAHINKYKLKPQT